jgi:hypothetical protein
MSLTQIADRLIAVLPPAFIILILLNIGFLGMTMWTVSHNTEVRNALLTKILDNCLQQKKD